MKYLTFCHFFLEDTQEIYANFSSLPTLPESQGIPFISSYDLLGYSKQPSHISDNKQFDIGF